MNQQRLLTIFRSIVPQLTQVNQFKFTPSAADQGVQRENFRHLCCELFADLLQIGECCAASCVTTLANQPTFNPYLIEVIEQTARLLFQPVSENICLFLQTYPESNIDTSGEALSEEWCMVRSGYQYILDLFRNVPIDGDRGQLVNKGLDRLASYSESFDSYLKLWHNSAFDVHADLVPFGVLTGPWRSSHWWWFE